MQELIVLLAHGSPDQTWSDTFVSLTQQTCNEHSNVKLAFMDLSQPSLQQVVTEGARAGYTLIKVLPLFLAKGKHLKQDVPNMLSNLEAELNINTTLLAPIGEQAEISVAINDIINRLISP